MSHKNGLMEWFRVYLFHDLDGYGREVKSVTESIFERNERKL